MAKIFLFYIKPLILSQQKINELSSVFWFAISFKKEIPKAYLGAIQISIMEFIAQKVPVFGVILVRIQFECENNSEYGLFSSSAYCENSFKKISIIDV